MNPQLRFSLSLVVSLVLWYPTMRASLGGEIDLLSASLRYVFAFGFAWFALAGISALLDGYRADADEAADDGERSRRADDVTERDYGDFGDLAPAVDD